MNEKRAAKPILLVFFCEPSSVQKSVLSIVKGCAVGDGQGVRLRVMFDVCEVEVGVMDQARQVTDCVGGIHSLCFC